MSQSHTPAVLNSPMNRPGQLQVTSPQSSTVVSPKATPRPAIDFSDWDSKTSALLSEAQKDSIMRLAELYTDHVPFPNDLFPEELDEKPSTPYAESTIPNTLPIAASAAEKSTSNTKSPLDLSEPIHSTQDFLAWFADIEAEMEHSQEDVYRTHLQMLSEYLARCDSIMGEIETTEKLLGLQTKSYDFVSSRTSSLKEACESLLEEQEALGKLADEIRERLKVFDLLEPAVKMLSAGGDGVCLQEGFPEMLSNLDGALDFVSEHLRYKDSELYMMKFRQCMTRGLTLIKMHFVGSMRNLVVDIQQRISDRQQSSSTGDVLAKGLQTSLFYMKFKALATTLRPLIQEIEKRCDGHREYLGLLGECTGSFFAARKALLGPIILTEIMSIAEGKDMLAIAKDGAAYVLNVCTDECALFYQFFSLGQDDFGRYLETLCSALYDHLRPLILREPHINMLTELCRTLQIHLEAVDSLGGISNPEIIDDVPILNLPPSLTDVAPGSSFSSTEQLDWKASNFDSASAKVAVEKILQDAQERLAFRSQGFIRSEIEGFKPTDRELEVFARSEKLPQPNVLAQPNMVPDMASSQASAAFLAETEEGASTESDPFSQHLAFGKIVYGSGEWYPTLQKTLYILGKMYRALPGVIFEDLSQEAISLCLKSLLSATEVIEKKTTKIDGQFFLIKNLLMLREQIAPFDSNFVRREELLDFSNMQETVNAILQSGWDFSKIASIGLGFVSNPVVVPRVIETFTDARRAVSDELRKVCEAMILETAKGAMEPVASFMIKATAFKLKQERETRQAHSARGSERLGMQSFASPQNCVAVSEALKETLKEKVGLSVKKMKDYIGEPKTEDVLIYHVKTNVVETYTVFYNTVTGEHDHRVIQGFMSIKDVSSLVDEACALRTSVTSPQNT